MHIYIHIRWTLLSRVIVCYFLCWVYTHMYSEQEEHEIRSMTSQVFLFFFLVGMYIHTHCLTDHKCMSFCIWTGEWIIDRFNRIYIYDLFCLQFKFHLIIFCLTSIHYHYDYKWANHLHSRQVQLENKRYMSIKVSMDEILSFRCRFTNADWQELLEYLWHPIDPSGHHLHYKRESILFIWYL